MYLNAVTALECPIVIRLAQPLFEENYSTSLKTRHRVNQIIWYSFLRFALQLFIRIYYPKVIPWSVHIERNCVNYVNLF